MAPRKQELAERTNPQKPPEERLLKVPEIDEQQRMYKK
jgi:hypothetical protein